MTQLQAIRAFCFEILGTKITIARRRMSSNWGMVLFEKNPRLYIPSNLNYKAEESDLLFYNNFISRYNEAKNFSDITLTLLHEIGHWKTQNMIDWYLDTKERDKIETMEDYLNLKSEFIATEWAINWLHNPINQNIAKQFEKNYFT